ncbi:DedA family protein [Paracoccus sp. p3-h83]|uniref:DedA family protein n=1 Tax=Paracoccus sp. p3-h83 TaxID=3342805 RepID=UPI0035BB66A3
MIQAGSAQVLIQDHGLAILAPLALIEGPVVSVIAGSLVSLGLMALRPVILCLIVADLLGDLLTYALGRYGRRAIPFGLLRRLGISRQRLARMVRGFRGQGGRLLVIGKLTQVAGLPMLLAAGMVRMPLPRFLVICGATAIPKTLLLVGLGHVFGTAWLATGGWRLPVLTAGSLALIAAALWWHRRPRLT